MNRSVWQMSFYVAFGAAMGANSRFWLGRWLTLFWPNHFPWATFAINVSGSFVLGALVAWLDPVEYPRTWAMFGVGLLGSYTTFSTFSVELLRLWQTGQPLQAVLYAGLSPFVGVLAAALGFWLTSRML